MEELEIAKNRKGGSETNRDEGCGLLGYRAAVLYLDSRQQYHFDESQDTLKELLSNFALGSFPPSRESLRRWGERIVVARGNERHQNAPHRNN